MAEMPMTPREVIRKSIRLGGTREADIQTEATLSALSEAGFVILPREPTEWMLERGKMWAAQTTETYDAMVRAYEE